MEETLENINPRVYSKLCPRDYNTNDAYDPVDAREIFDLICNIRDPEHPMTLEELGVVDLKNIKVDDENSEVIINFTPTIPHCSMATLIGLSIRVRLFRSLAPRFKVTVEITPGTHTSEHAINKQLADKERVAAAMENKHLFGVISQCISFVENNSKSNVKTDDIHKQIKKQVYGEVYKQLEDRKIETETYSKYGFLKSTHPELYENQLMLDKVEEKMRENKLPTKFPYEVDTDGPNDCSNIIAELNFLKAC